MNAFDVGVGMLVFAVGVFIGGALTGPLSMIQQTVFYFFLISGFAVTMLGQTLEYKKLALRCPIYTKEKNSQ